MASGLISGSSVNNVGNNGDAFGLSGASLSAIATPFNPAWRMLAGGDIVNSGGVFVHDDPADISVVAADGNIFYSNISLIGPGALQDAACLDNPLYVAKLIMDGEGVSSMETVPVADDLTGGNITVTPIPDGPSRDDFVYYSEGSRPESMSPEGVGRSGAFNEAKRQSGIPVSKSPDRVLPDVDK